MEEIAMPMGNAEWRSLVAKQNADLGVFSELIACAKLAQAGYAVSRALNGTQSGYDIIVDDGSRLLRAQVKTVSRNGKQVYIGRLRRRWVAGAPILSSVPKYSPSDFDLLVAVDRTTLVVYLIPVEVVDFGKTDVGLTSDLIVAL